MEGQITEKGHLRIKRISKFKSQFCPWNRDDGISECCGDWCVLFGEFVKIKGEYMLWLCNKTLYFSEFEDLRK